MRLVLQLIHVSDLHFAAPAEQVQAKRRGMVSRVASLPWLAGGLMGQDSAALVEFEDALSYVLVERMLGTDRPPNDPSKTSEVKAVSWIVCTGDLSTFGDGHGQVAAAATWLSGVAARKGINYCSIYGNHDVWDGTVPFNSTESALADRRTDLRNAHFPSTFPLAPVGPGTGVSAHGGAVNGLRVQLPVSRRDLVVASLNTVLHERLQNTFAYGEVKKDRYWQPSPGPDQHVDLLARANPDEIRIVLTHHPVHYPAQPYLGMRLLNDRHVGMQLSTRVGAASGLRGNPLATLVLSGHTHLTFPEPLSLPQDLPRNVADVQAPLGTGQLQLVAGTLSQRPLGSTSLTHDFTCLRFWEHDNGVLELEREVWRRRRPGPARPFRPVEDGNRNWVEPLILG